MCMNKAANIQLRTCLKTCYRKTVVLKETISCRIQINESWKWPSCPNSPRAAIIRGGQNYKPAPFFFLTPPVSGGRRMLRFQSYLISIRGFRELGIKGHYGQKHVFIYLNYWNLSLGLKVFQNPSTDIHRWTHQCTQRKKHPQYWSCFFICLHTKV